MSYDDQAVEAVTTAVREGLERGLVLLLVPGGSAARLCGPIAEVVEAMPYRERLSVSLSDERYGLPGHAASNWPAVERAFGSVARGIPVLRGAAMAETVANWQQTLEELVSEATVVALLGVGSDGHIAGIKPQSMADRADAPLAVGYRADDFERITITRRFFSLITTVVVYASGPDKQAVIHRLRAATDTAEPMQAIRLARHYEIYYDEG